jgi:hypothetical protein
MNRDAAFGTLTLAVAAIYYVLAATIPRSDLADPIGPQGLPRVYAFALGVLSMLLIARSLRRPNLEPRTAEPANLKDALLAEIRSGKAAFYNTVVAQAQRIEVAGDRITFVFGPAQSALRGWFDQQKTWLDAAAERLAGRKVLVTSVLGDGPAAAPADSGPRIPDPGTPSEKKRDLKAEAMSSSTVQAMLDVFPAEIRDVEEM